MKRASFAFVLVLLCSALARAAQDPREIPLVDQRGAPFTLAALRGRAVAVTFVASRCSDVCPISNAAFQTLAKRLANSGSTAALVTITLDPGYDSPFVMSRVARAMDTDPNRWRVASGTPRDIASLMRAFGISVHDDKAGVPDAHSSFVYVFDRNGRLRRTLLLSTHVVDDAAAALR